MAQHERLARSVGGRGGHEGPEVHPGPHPLSPYATRNSRGPATTGAMDAAVPVDANSRAHRDLQNRADRGFTQRPQPSSTRENKNLEQLETRPVPRPLFKFARSQVNANTPGEVAHEGARRVAHGGGAHRALKHGGEEGAEELVREGPQLLFELLRFLCRLGRWSTGVELQRPPEGSAQVNGNVSQDRSRCSGCRWGCCPFQRTIMGIPSSNVQYHPPRLSENQLNLPQPHSPSLPTHCSGKSGMRPLRRHRAHPLTGPTWPATGGRPGPPPRRGRSRPRPPPAACGGH